MKYSRLATGVVLTGLVACNHTGGEWKMMRNKTNVCEISVPADWTIDVQLGSLARAPKNQALVSVGSQTAGTVQPLSEATQKALKVDRIIENTSQRVFWSNQTPEKEPRITPYHVFVPGKAGVCMALISIHPGVSEDLVKKIGETLAPVK